MTCALFAAAWNCRIGVPFDERYARKTLSAGGALLAELAGLIGSDQSPAGAIRRHVRDLISLFADLDRNRLAMSRASQHGGHDPLMRFHEELLRACDPTTRNTRGVFTTPEPVVSYMVRSVDHLLRDRLSCAQGLSCRVSHGAKTDPNVIVLDPACGTGSFLSGVLEHAGEPSELDTVSDSADRTAELAGPLRLVGFELHPAAWAIARLHLAALAAGTDSRFPRRERRKGEHRLAPPIRIELKNSLEMRRPVADATRSRSCVVVLGNPPYRGLSSNRGQWIDRLLRGDDNGQPGKDGYYTVEGKPLREKKVWLQDDYVKFIRYGQWQVQRAGAGILAFVTNHAYLDNPTFRGMRESLMHTFDEISIVDLHGNAQKKELCPDGKRDENIFDIRQGVAVAFFIKRFSRRSTSRVRHAELWGTRRAKLSRLAAEHLGRTTLRPVRPKRPFYFFAPRNESLRAEYEQHVKITDLMPVFTTGMVTARDHFVIDFDRDSLLSRMREFRSRRATDEEIRQRFFSSKGSSRYPPGDTRGWKLHQARKAMRKDQHWRDRIQTCLYRPFDLRHIYHTPEMVDWPRTDVLRHVQAGDNLALITVRQVAERDFNHVFVTDRPAEGRVTRSNKGIAYLFPLYLYDKKRHPNLDAASHGALRENDDPESVFRYVYAVLHSPAYRRRYAELLRSDFPRIPFVRDAERFAELVRLGGELIETHLLQDEAPEIAPSRFPVGGPNTIAPGYPRFVAAGMNGKVFINGGDTARNVSPQYFDAVPDRVWEFQLCGYPVCRKWLADRRGRALTDRDIRLYARILDAVERTIEVTKRIDAVVPSWPSP